MHDTESFILSYSTPKRVTNTWLSAEIASAALLGVEALVFVGAMLKAANHSSASDYGSAIYITFAVVICLALEFLALGLAGVGAKHRGQFTFLLGLHGLLVGIFGLMALPLLF